MFFRVLTSGFRFPISDGAIAQLGERVLCKHEVVGSIPSGSTIRTTEDGRRRTDDGGAVGLVLGVSRF